MRLIVVISILYLIVAFGVFIASGIITYQTIKKEIDIEQRRFLVERLKPTERFIERRQPQEPILREKMAIIPLRDSLVTGSYVFSDTLVMHTTLQRLEPHMKMSTVSKVGDKFYKIELYDIVIESDDIIDGIVESIIKSYVILLISFSIIGAILSYFILNPFRQSLNFIQRFSLTQPTTGRFSNLGIKEFRKLNDFLLEMTKKMVADYNSLKEFTENASHELQTPLAIAQGKLETLSNDDQINEEQLNLIISAQNSLSRLSKLSNTLSLLTKIGNNEFIRRDTINIGKTITILSNDFNELIHLKGIHLKLEIENEVSIKAEKGLIEILITNLLNNAIRHNLNNGLITIMLKNGQLIIENTSKDFVENPEMLFERFRKTNQSSNSLGLGLAIVKRIVDFYQFGIEYRCEKVDFSSEAGLADARFLHRIEIKF